MWNLETGNTIKIFQHWFLIVALVVGLCSDVLFAQNTTFEGPPIDYHEADVNDPVAKLAKRIEAGEVKLEYEANMGYLRSVLDLLEIPESSQSLVFSKTSMQLPDR